jgi:glycosyltransferase involved in cell wall biosynthesis
MKVLFLVKSEKFPSARIRVKNLLPILEQYNIESEVKTIPWNLFRKRKLFASAAEYAVVVLQKQLISKQDSELLRRHSKKIIFDFDDAIYYNNTYSHNPANYHINKQKFKRFKQIINYSDSIISANKTLASQAREINNKIPIHIIPSVVETNVASKKDYQLQEPAIIGWIGTQSNLKFLLHIAPALKIIAKEYDYILRIISAHTIDIPEINIEFKKWILETQYEEIANFYIGIMPLPLNPYSEGKSAYKLLQYMSVGVPALASAVGMNNEIGKDYVNCLLANDIDMFTDKIKLLLLDTQYRKSLGAKERKLFFRFLKFTRKHE